MMNKNKFIVFGEKEPKATKRNNLIKRAVKKAVNDYRETFVKLAGV